MLRRVENVEDSSDSYARFEMTAICKRIGRGGRKAGGVDASGSGGVLARIDTQFPHERLHGVEGFRTLSHAKGIFEQGHWNFIELLRAPFGSRADILLNFFLR